MDRDGRVTDEGVLPVTDSDQILVPRNLLAAACHCVRKHAGVSSETYRQLSVLSLSAASQSRWRPDRETVARLIYAGSIHQLDDNGATTGNAHINAAMAGDPHARAHSGPDEARKIADAILALPSSPSDLNTAGREEGE